MEKVPKLITTLNTVISEDPTLRLPISEQESTSFILTCMMVSMESIMKHISQLI